jgi:hypothetical protein
LPGRNRRPTPRADTVGAGIQPRLGVIEFEEFGQVLGARTLSRLPLEGQGEAFRVVLLVCPVAPGAAYGDEARLDVGETLLKEVSPIVDPAPPQRRVAPGQAAPDPELPDPELPDPELPDPELPDPELPEVEPPDVEPLDVELPDPVPTDARAALVAASAASVTRSPIGMFSSAKSVACLATR